MEPPPLSAAMMPPNIIQQIHPDSIESTSSPQPPLPPRPRIGETTNDESLLPNTKLRLMCSYGGHIMPRPHDKSLSYVGGDTRIVVVDRQSSLRDLCFRLSRTILNGRPFTLKYQLPNEDLDNLITVTTDEDLDNMIEEYDRLAASAASNIKSSSSSRLRVFLFFTKPESTLSMGCLLDDAKSETWFVDALNNSGILSRGVSDSAAGDCFVNLDSVPASNSSSNLEGQGVVAESLNLLDDNSNNNNKVKNVSDVVVNSISTPGSPMLENSSSMANLAPIRVRVDENNGGSRLQQENRIGVVEEQFAQMTFSGVKPDEGFVVVSSAMPVIPAAVTMASAGVVTSNSSDNVNRIVSEEERLDYGAVVGSRKPPLPLQYVQQRSSGALSLPSPDSVTSESSIASTNSFSKIVYHQEQVQVQPTHLDNKTLPMPNSDNITGLQRDQPQEPSYMLQPQMDQNQQLQQPQQQQQQQFVHSSTHYIHHPTNATGQMPVSSYYQVYAAQPSQQQLHHPITQQQYPVYVMPVGPTPQYNMALQHSLSDPTLVSSGIPLMQQQTSSATPPIYPTKSATPIPEVNNSTVYPNVASNSGFVQIPSNQFQQQYVGMPQYHHHHHPPQQISVAPPSGGTNYGYEYGGHVQEQAYYTQQQQQPQQTNATLVTQYQSMTPAAAAAALSDASKQFSAADNVQQPNRTSQPV